MIRQKRLNGTRIKGCSPLQNSHWLFFPFIILNSKNKNKEKETRQLSVWPVEAKKRLSIDTLGRPQTIPDALNTFHLINRCEEPNSFYLQELPSANRRWQIEGDWIETEEG